MNLGTSARRYGPIYFFAVIISLLLSVIIYGHSEVINTDGICYVESAAALEHMGLRQMMHLCDQAIWPFYSALIFFFAQLTAVSYINSAHLLNGFFSLLSVVAFMGIAHTLGGSKRVVILAAAVIFLAHEFNSVKQYIIRDHGFWAFYLLSMLGYLQFFRRPSWLHALATTCSLLVAALFRIEGIFFLVFLPWVVWLRRNDSWWLRAQYFLQLNTALLFASAAFAAWWLFHPEYQLKDFGRLHEFLLHAQNGLQQIIYHFKHAEYALAHYALPHDSVNEAALIWGLALPLWYVSEIFRNVSWVYALLIAYAWVKRIPKFSHSMGMVLGAYIALNIFMTSVFFLERLFLSGRYLVALSLVLMVWVPFALDALWALANRFTKFVLVIALLVTGIGGIFDFGYSKNYLRTSGIWLEQNIPANAALYSNDYVVMYYSKHYGHEVFKKAKQYKNLETIAHNKWQAFDYIAVRVGKKGNQEVAALKQLMPIQVFANRRGDQVRIYKIHKG